MAFAWWAVVAVAVAADAINPPSYPGWMPNLTDLRHVDSSWNSKADCLFKVRERVMRPYPGNCYTKGGFNYDYQDQWWKFWQENRGDISYTFDQVLYDEGPAESAFKNQLWYLIAYLKQLRLHIPNPLDILSGSVAVKMTKHASTKHSVIVLELEQVANQNGKHLMTLKATIAAKKKNISK